MAGAAKSYDATKIVLGPCDIWVNVAVPSAGARMTVALSAAGQPTPDATANSSAIHLGMTKSGATFEYKPETQDFNSDELTFPHLSRILTETAMIKAELLQVFDWNILETITVGGTKTINTSTTSGYHSMTFGGLSAVTTYPIAIVGTDISDSTKYWVIQLYKAYNKAGWAFNVTRKDQSGIPVEFQGLGIVTRAVGDQAGNYWKSLVAAA
jgi:hypothetical protein